MKCAVASCTKTNRLKPVQCSFFKFPSDQKIMKKWLQFCRQKKNFNPKTGGVCMYHFKSEDFANNLQFQMGFTKKRVLKRYAVPTIYDSNAANSARVQRVQRRENKKIVSQLLAQNKDTILREGPPDSSPHIIDPRVAIEVDSDDSQMYDNSYLQKRPEQSSNLNPKTLSVDSNLPITQEKNEVISTNETTIIRPQVGPYVKNWVGFKMPTTDHTQTSQWPQLAQRVLLITVPSIVRMHPTPPAVQNQAANVRVDNQAVKSNDTDESLLEVKDEGIDLDTEESEVEPKLDTMPATSTPTTKNSEWSLVKVKTIESINNSMPINHTTIAPPDVIDDTEKKLQPLAVESKEEELPKQVSNYADALKLLKPLEEFAMLQENYRVIGLISQLEGIFKNPPKRQNDHDYAMGNR